MVEVKARSDGGRRGDNSTGSDDGDGGDDGGGKKVEKVGAWWVLPLVVTQCLEVAVWAAMSDLEARWEGVMVEMALSDGGSGVKVQDGGGDEVRWMGWWFGQ